MTTPPELQPFLPAQRAFGSVVHRVGADQWSSPTPCTEWDVRALVNHLVYEQLWATPMLEGTTVDEAGDRFDGDLLGSDPVSAWDLAAKESAAAFSYAWSCVGKSSGATCGSLSLASSATATVAANALALGTYTFTQPFIIDELRLRARRDR